MVGNVSWEERLEEMDDTWRAMFIDYFKRTGLRPTVQEIAIVAGVNPRHAANIMSKDERVKHPGQFKPDIVPKLMAAFLLCYTCGQKLPDNMPARRPRKRKKKKGMQNGEEHISSRDE